MVEKNIGFNRTGFHTPAYDYLNYFFYTLFKKWWLILILGMGAGILGYFYAKRQKVVYKSKLTFALDQGQGGDISGALSLAGQFGISLGGGQDVFAGDNILEIMKSRRMIEGTLLAIDTFNNQPITFIEYFLQQNQQPKSKKREIFFPVGQDRKAFNYKQDSVLFQVYQQFLNGFITADKPDKKYNIYEVNVINPSEQFVKNFTEKIVTETNKFYTEISTKKNKETLEILENRVAAMKGNVNNSISSRAQIQDVNLNPAFSSAQVPVLKQQANIQVYSGAYAEMFKNLEVARYQYLKQIPLMQIIDDANYPMQKVKTSKLKMAILFSAIAVFITILTLWLISLFRALPLKKNFEGS